MNRLAGLVALTLMVLTGCGPSNELPQIDHMSSGNYIIKIGNDRYRAVQVRSNGIINDVELKPIKDSEVKTNLYGWITRARLEAVDIEQCAFLWLNGINSSAPQFLFKPFMLSERLANSCSISQEDRWHQI